MNILLVVNEQKDPGFALANRVAEIIGGRAALFVPENQGKSHIKKTQILNQNLYAVLDLILVLGGDGTLLSVARTASELGIPVIGINLGRLGFLAEIELNEIEEGMSRLFAGDYMLEDRMMLQAETADGRKTTALNDIVVTRANSTLKILDMDVFIDDEYVDDFKADGIIIATPTGSTAYSLSAGGPIVDPALDSMIITPVCPHKMYSRTIIVPPEKTVTVKCGTSAENEAVVAADSEIFGRLSSNETVVIKIAPKRFQLIRFKEYRFFGVLHNKLVKKES